MVEQPIQLLTGQGQVVDGVICTMEQRPLRVFRDEDETQVVDGVILHHGAAPSGGL